MWKTRDPEVNMRLRRSFDGLAAADMRKVPVDVAVEGGVGSPLTVTLRWVRGMSQECTAMLMCGSGLQFAALRSSLHLLVDRHCRGVHEIRGRGGQPETW